MEMGLSLVPLGIGLEAGLGCVVQEGTPRGADDVPAPPLPADAILHFLRFLMHKGIFILLVLVGTSLCAQTKKVCFSIDDLPVVSYGINDADYQVQLTKSLLEHLKRYQVPAIGFVNERKLFRDGKLLDFQYECLRMWLAYGMDLGNHTFAHPDFNNTPLEVFTDDITRGEKITKQLLHASGKQMRYFRHPFLHVGHTKERADSLQFFLEKQGYTTAPVTIDNEDYLFALAYHRLLSQKDSLRARVLGSDYLLYMEKKLLYFEQQSEALFGRNMAHILLLHANKLNADYIGQLAAVYQKHGYEFVTMQEALQDPAYQTPVTQFGKYGISWIDRWALSAGKKRDFFKNDPETPPYVVALSK